MLAPRIPRDFLEGLARDFGPDQEMRVRWSPVRNRWQIERKGKDFSKPADPRDRFDTWARVATGYYRVLEASPGSLITCSYCGTDFEHPVYSYQATLCPKCGKQELVMNWPLGDRLLEHLRFTDPGRDGLQRLWDDLTSEEAQLEVSQQREKETLGEAIWKEEFTRIFEIQSRGYEGPAKFWKDAPESKRFGGNP